MKTIKVYVIILTSLLLISCGGGGGGSSDGGGSSNIRQFSNSAPIVNIDESKIPFVGTGTKDPYFMAGGGYGSNVVSATDSVFQNGASIFGIRIRGNISGDGSLTVPNPPEDIRTAWRDGWTGQGVNVLIIDTFSDDLSDDNHGFITTMAAIETAPNAGIYGLNVDLDGRETTYELAEEAPNSTRIDVINMSFGTDPVANPNTNTLRNEYINNYSILSGDVLTNIKDAVLVKAAGNEAANANLVAENLFLATDETTKARILIVGALDKYAQKGGANIASYSNRASDNEAVSRRFLVEYGGSPFGQDVYLCTKDSTNPADCNLKRFATLEGTSFAAPRVSGLAALVRHKFNNLTGAQTAKILLDTATTQGLICHPNCNSQVYGQGRVNITDALSPIGKLR